jgi:iron complex outermembrane receptor protein/vitamin B12 transporter
MPRRFTLLFVLLAAIPAHAVIIRGKVTDSLGRPLPGSRVQLISLSEGARNIADTIAGYDGTYELRSSLAGRFLLLTSPAMNTHQIAPQIGNPFYGGRTDLLTIDVALDVSSITQQSSAQPTLLDSPLPQLSDAPAQVEADQLLTRAMGFPELRPTAGAFIVQLGQTGTPAQLYLRGAPVTKTLIDGVSAEQLGGGFNLETISSSGLAAFASTPAVELTPGANPLYTTDAASGELAFQSAIASTFHPTLTYSGDAGTLSTVRNEAIAGIAYSRVDALASFARFNTDNDLPARRIHLITSAANVGYYISANTSLRATARDDVDAAPLPSPFAFYDLAPATKLASQNLIGAFTFETRTTGNWHNLLRYGLVRERSQAYNFATPASGLPVTITGANGYTASGTASFPPLAAREDAVTDRDEYTYQTDYPVAHFLTALLTAQYQDERGADLTAAQTFRLDRSHFSVAASFQGDIRNRLFYAASGFFDHSRQLGTHGAPRLGLTYVPVHPGARRFRGTSLHFTAATGVGEPSVVESELLANPISPRSRNFDATVDQTILPQKLSFRATYFHSQLSHQVETLNLDPLVLSKALAYRTQGLEAELRYQPTSRFLIEGGYTYLASLVERSAASAISNPNLPGIAIGAATALAGARPFHRPPNTGFAAAEYTARAFSASLKATFAGRSDDTTGLLLNPALLLPNRNLSPGYASVDAHFTYNVSHAVVFFTQLDNLLDQRHIAPIGYLSTPFLIRLGLRVRLGRE